MIRERFFGQKGGSRPFSPGIHDKKDMRWVPCIFGLYVSFHWLSKNHEEDLRDFLWSFFKKLNLFKQFLINTFKGFFLMKLIFFFYKLPKLFLSKIILRAKPLNSKLSSQREKEKEFERLKLVTTLERGLKNCKRAPVKFIGELGRKGRLFLEGKGRQSFASYLWKTFAFSGPSRSSSFSCS